MKQIIKISMCFFLMLGVSCIQRVSANELSAYTTEDAEGIGADQSDDILSTITAENIEVSNDYTGHIEMSKDYSSAYNDYKNYGVLYQQFTGITTLDYLRFSVVIDGRPVEGYTIEKNIKTNPADNKSFLNTAQEFDIIIEVMISNSNGRSITIEKVVKAKVVKVVGKVINRKAHATADLVIRYEGNVLDQLNESVHSDLKVQLLDGTISDVKGLRAQGMAGMGPNGNFLGGLGGAYDLKYILEDATNPLDYQTDMQGYLVDKDYNLVDPNGNIIISYEDREIKSFTSTLEEIKLFAKVGTIPDSAVLESNERTELNLSKPYVAYDMSVICNGEKIQPAGSVNLAVAIPSNLQNRTLGVYFMDEQGNLEELTSTVNDGLISFTTSHFSTYVIMEKAGNSVIPIDPVNPEESVPKENISTNDAIKNTAQHGLNTGNPPLVLLYISLLAVSASIIFVIRKKKELNK